MLATVQAPTFKNPDRERPDTLDRGMRWMQKSMPEPVNWVNCSWLLIIQMTMTMIMEMATILIVITYSNN